MPSLSVDSDMDASLETIRNQIVALLPRLRRFAVSLTGNVADADDLVQDTVERALKNLHQWERGTRLDSWMYRIARNRFIDGRRARKTAGGVFLDASGEAETVAIDGARMAEQRLTFAATCRALQTLPEEQRSAVALVLIDGMSYRQAADTLGIPIGTLTSRIARARATLSAEVFGAETVEG